jgi:hypothetical protein
VVPEVRNNERFSRAKVEKVVSPPQNPIIQNKVFELYIDVFRIKWSARMPIIKEPIAFAIKVGQG